MATSKNIEIPSNWSEPPIMWKTISTFAERKRPLEVFIQNKTKYELKLEEDFLDTGERIRTIFKDSIGPQSDWLTLVANKSPSFQLSVGGGLKYRFKETNCILYIGFRNPFIGNHLAFVELSNVEHPAKWSFDEAKGDNFRSSSFEKLRASVEVVNAIYCSSKRIVFRVEECV
ncbi:hypothetical protein CHS0354_037493 [Potamilus streckersoni]|uniref:Uncharacterized protein n=1 Tax=Potamilus streckersoni TaxID=2493646 RepID=A0AAE0VHK7_9BIVA|nr:hypothetical protein CHS0354_037493 [Potamilus streckersoni]